MDSVPRNSAPFSSAAPPFAPDQSGKERYGDERGAPPSDLATQTSKRSQSDFLELRKLREKEVHHHSPASTPTASEVSSGSTSNSDRLEQRNPDNVNGDHQVNSHDSRSFPHAENDARKKKWVDPWQQQFGEHSGTGQCTAPLTQINEPLYNASTPGQVYRTVTASSDGKHQTSNAKQETQRTEQTADAKEDTSNDVRIKVDSMLQQARSQYSARKFNETVQLCEQVDAQACRLDPQRTDNLLLLGAAQFQLGNYQQCIDANRKAIEINPHFAEAYGNLGNGLKEMGDLQGAIQFYCKAIELQPKFCDAYNNLAAAYMQRGQPQQAMETYHMVLMLNPDLVDALSNLGSLYKSQGHLDKAIQCYMEAIEKNPFFAIAWGNLAGVYKDKKDMQTAIRYYKEAIRLDPNFVDAHSNLGNTYKECGMIHEAKQAYQKAIELNPRNAIAYGNLASCYYDEGDMDMAIETYTKALELEPNFPDVYNNLGNAYRELSRFDQSITCYRKALELKRDHPHAYNNLGNSFKDKGMIQESVQCYRTAIQLLPSFAAAHSNLASILKEQGKINEAIAHYQEALRIDPHFADAYSNLGNAYKDIGRLNDSILCYSTAIRLKPNFADAYSNLASAYKDSGRIPEAVVCYRKALELKPHFPDAFSNLVHSLVLVCDWRSRRKDFEKLREILDEQIEKALATEDDDGTGETYGKMVLLPSVQPFHSLVYPMSLHQMQLLAKAYARRAKLNVANLGAYRPVFTFPSALQMRPQHTRIRIGYVSSDFGNHPLSHLMQSVFGMHNMGRFEVFCYSLSPDDGSFWRRKIVSEMEPGHFIDLSAFSHVDAAKRIAADIIHILVNLNGYTKGARNEIFALKPAPIQVSYMGFCGTMGADYIDYFIVDKTVVPSVVRQYYTEKLIYMPHSYFVNDHRQSARDVLDPSKLPTRAKYGISKEMFVFANFNQIYKIDPCTFRAWMSILKRTPNSILWLLRFPASGETNIKMAAEAFGVDPRRIHFTDVAAKDEHLRRGVLVDLFLDTPVCNAHTTGCDILWAGVPMITLPGEKLASRVAASLLNAAGLPDCITHSMKQYEDLAVHLATERDRRTLRKLRKRLELYRHYCPLFDTPRWVRNLERSFGNIWHRFERGLPPDDIEIADYKTRQYSRPIAAIAEDVSFNESTSENAEKMVAEYSERNPRTDEPSLSSVVASGLPPLTSEQSFPTMHGGMVPQQQIYFHPMSQNVMGHHPYNNFYPQQYHGHFPNDQGHPMFTAQQLHPGGAASFSHMPGGGAHMQSIAPEMRHTWSPQDQGMMPLNLHTTNEAYHQPYPYNINGGGGGGGYAQFHTGWGIHPPVPPGAWNPTGGMKIQSQHPMYQQGYSMHEYFLSSQGLIDSK